MLVWTGVSLPVPWNSRCSPSRMLYTDGGTTRWAPLKILSLGGRTGRLLTQTPGFGDWMAPVQKRDLHLGQRDVHARAPCG